MGEHDDQDGGGLRAGRLMPGPRSRLGRRAAVKPETYVGQACYAKLRSFKTQIPGGFMGIRQAGLFVLMLRRSSRSASRRIHRVWDPARVSRTLAGDKRPPVWPRKII